MTLYMFALMFGLTNGVGLPLGLPPGPEDPVARNAAPAECLFYTSWAGTAKADPASGNQTEQLLAEPEVQQFVAGIEQSLRESLRTWAAHNEPENAAIVDDLVTMVKTALVSPGAVYVGRVARAGNPNVKIQAGGDPDPYEPYGPPYGHKLDNQAGSLPSTIQAGGVFNFGDDAAKARPLLEKCRKALGEDAVTTLQIDGETFYRMKPDREGPSYTWGMHGKHFVVGIGDGEAESLVKRLSGSPPAWLVQARQRLAVERVATLTYINLQAAIRTAGAAVADNETKALVVALGLDSFASLVAVSGLDKTGCVDRLFLATEKEGADTLAFLGGKPLEAKDLAPIPRDATLAGSIRLDAYQFWRRFQSIAVEIDPRAASEMTEALCDLEKRLGFRIGEDALKSLGDVWCVYNSPGEGGLVVTGLTAVVPLADRDRAVAANAKLVTFWNGYLAAEAVLAGSGPTFGSNRPTAIRTSRFADRTIFTFAAAMSPVSPSWCLTDKELIVALYPQNVRAYLSRRADFQSLAAAPEVAEALRAKDGPAALGYMNTPELFRMLYPVVSIEGQVLFGEMFGEDASLVPSMLSIGRHLRPGVQAMRRTKDGIELTVQHSLPAYGAVALMPMMNILPAYVGSPNRITAPPTARVRGMNNLKQIAMAIRMYSDSGPAYPSPGAAPIPAGVTPFPAGTVPGPQWGAPTPPPGAAPAPPTYAPAPYAPNPAGAPSAAPAPVPYYPSPSAPTPVPPSSSPAPAVVTPPPAPPPAPGYRPLSGGPPPAPAPGYGPNPEDFMPVPGPSRANDPPLVGEPVPASGAGQDPAAAAVPAGVTPTPVPVPAYYPASAPPPYRPATGIPTPAPTGTPISVPAGLRPGDLASAPPVPAGTVISGSARAPVPTFPAAFTVDKDGKPLLSWRVTILPFLGQEALYKQFHLDEPWDSAHNKKLIAQMPDVYRAPGSKAGPGKTNYLTIRAKDSVFPGAEKVTHGDIQNFGSNTILVVEADDSAAVEWTRPDDFVPDPKQVTKGLLGLRPGGFAAAFADGSVRFLPDNTDPADLRRMFTRAGGVASAPNNGFLPARW